MFPLTAAQLEWLERRVPDPKVSPKGGRPPANKRKTLGGIFWILDKGAKWKDLPAEFGSRSTVHRWFQTWRAAGVFEQIAREAGRLLAQRNGYRVYECVVGPPAGVVHPQAANAAGWKAPHGDVEVEWDNIMLVLDLKGAPVAVDTAPGQADRDALVEDLLALASSSQITRRVPADAARFTGGGRDVQWPGQPGDLRPTQQRAGPSLGSDAPDQLDSGDGSKRPAADVGQPCPSEQRVD